MVKEPLVYGDVPRECEAPRCRGEEIVCSRTKVRDDRRKLYRPVRASKRG